MNAPSEDDDETLEYVFDDVFQRYGILGSGWGLDEESLYWIDHDERLTELENPKRSFLEVRGIDENWEYAGDEGIMRYFGLLVEADYQLPLTENGEVLQEHRVSLCIELPDTITYPDLNGDGYADMRVGAPVHSSGAKAVEEDYTSPSYLLWDPQTEEFERKTEKEVENSRRAVANGLTEEEQEKKTKRERRDSFALVQELPEGAEPEDWEAFQAEVIRCSP